MSKPRDLPIALAHETVRAKMGDTKRRALLDRIYLAMSWADKARCRAEVVRCHEARRGLKEAVLP